MTVALKDDTVLLLGLLAFVLLLVLIVAIFALVAKRMDNKRKDDDE